MSKPTGADPEGSAESRERADRLIGQGQDLEDAGDLVAAEAIFREAIRVAPSNPRADINLGNVLQKLGLPLDAADSHRAAIASDPNFVGGHFNLGAVLVELGHTEQAKAHLERALELKPDMADAAIVLASAYEAEGNLPMARAQLECALSIDPQHPGAAGNLGGVLLEMGETHAAETLFRTALQVDPDSIPALTGLARIDVQRGRADLTDALYRHALRVDSSDPGLWSSFLFSLNLRDDLDAESVAREHFAFGRKFERHDLAVVPRRAITRRMRVGYVSADLMKHPVGLFLRPVLAAHDRAEFETICYSNNHHEDELTLELRERCDQWRLIAGHDDVAVADQIRADEVDILVDLGGHTINNRLGVFVQRPAPFHATLLGYLNTTGLSSVDFRICDGFTDPEAATETLNSEALVRLPNSQWCYQPYYDIPLAHRPVQTHRPIVFGSFNQLAKLSEACLDLWAAILREVPHSQLRVFGVPTGVMPDDFCARMARRGVQDNRVTLTGRIGIRDYFAAMQDVDIALDSLPYNGATTTLDTLWMGTPVIGLRGDRAIGRGTYSILSACGLGDLTAESPTEYVEKNVRLARDSAGRSALRGALRTRLEGSPLMTTKTFTRDLESLYRSMLNAR